MQQCLGNIIAVLWIVLLVILILLLLWTIFSCDKRSKIRPIPVYVVENRHKRSRSRSCENKESSCEKESSHEKESSCEKKESSDKHSEDN